MVWTSDVSWGWRVLGLQWPILVLMLAWPALGMSEQDRSRVQGWVFGSAGLALMVCLAWGGWHLSQGEVLEGRDWSPWVSHVRLSLFAALGWVGGHVQGNVATGLVFHRVVRLCGGHGLADQRGAPPDVLGLDRIAPHSKHLAAMVPWRGAHLDWTCGHGRSLDAPTHPFARPTLAHHHILGQPLPTPSGAFGL